MPTEPEIPIMYEGRMVPYAEAEKWVSLLEHAATTAAYAATPEGWQGYAEWLWGQAPELADMAPMGRSESARQGCEADAVHLLEMAHIARGKLERAANERN